jgi:Glycosyl hydrolases family 28
VPGKRAFDVADFGAVGDGYAADTAAVQAAIDACAADGGGRVLLRGTRWYRVGTIRLRDRVDLHLDEGAVLRASLDRAGYPRDALIVADGARGISITGPGRIEGRSGHFMTRWDPAGQIYQPAAWRPRMFALRGCRDVVIRDVTLADAPFWGLHLLGCDHVGVERFTVRNNLQVPNCDGIDIDHCRDVEVRDCSVHTGDDAIVVKTTGQAGGEVRGVHVHDCELVTQDSALKIGSETTAGISGIRFERCHVPSCNRACTIQLRDAGDVHDVTFTDITFTSRYFADPWWGHGEGVCVTALPRDGRSATGQVSGLTLRRIRGESENSLRLEGSAGSRLRDVLLDDVGVRLSRWTGFAGGVFDNRPAAGPGLVPHDTPGIYIAHADRVRLRDARVSWAGGVPEYFTHALTCVDVTDLDLAGFYGQAARPGIAAISREPGH